MATTTTSKKAKAPGSEQGERLMQPIEPASGDHEGVPFVLNPSELFNPEHELVRAFPHLFHPARALRPVETATAAPGELRGNPNP